MNICEKYSTPSRPERILQFGEGNFLRAFADWMVDGANKKGVYDGNIVICQPIESGLCDALNAQKGVYTAILRGLEGGRKLEDFYQVTSVSRCINPYKDYGALMGLARSPESEVVISNTTEAGIAYRAGERLEDRPPVSFPAKAAAFLYERYKAFGGAAEKGLLFLPVELIEENGRKLKELILKHAAEWELPAGFARWVEENNHFCDTLVDRIVTGYPREEAASLEERLGYEDRLITTGEPFHLWVIQGRKEWAERLPLREAGFNVLWTDDLTPYRTRKVRILNGAHTMSALAAYLCGHDTVLEMMGDALFLEYIKRGLKGEIMPTLTLPMEELESFAGSVLERFANPFIKHKLLDISLNSASKFRERCLPSILGYMEREGKPPRLLSFAWAAFARFYKGAQADGGAYTGAREGGGAYTVRDGAEVLDFFGKLWSGPGARGDWEGFASEMLASAELWGRDLSGEAKLRSAVAEDLGKIMRDGVKGALRARIGESL